MKDNYEVEEKRQAAADVLHQYSKFVIARVGSRVSPCDLRMHLMKEISGMPTTLKRPVVPPRASSPAAMGESSGSSKERLDKADSFNAL